MKRGDGREIRRPKSNTPRGKNLTMDGKRAEGISDPSRFGERVPLSDPLAPGPQKRKPLHKALRRGA